MEHPQSPGKGITDGIESVYLSLGVSVSAGLAQRGYVTEVTSGWKKENLVSMVLVSQLNCCHYFLLFGYERQAVFGLQTQGATCIKYGCRSSFPRVINKFMSSYFNIA